MTPDHSKIISSHVRTCISHPVIKTGLHFAVHHIQRYRFCNAKMIGSGGSNTPLFIYPPASKGFGICAAFIFALSCLTNTATAQPGDSSHNRVSIRNRDWKKAITVPGVLISAGLISLTDNDILDNEGTAELRNRIAPEFHTHVDDYLQYAPILGVYGLSVLGVKGKHDFKNGTALLIKSELIMAAITFSLKKIVAEPRPDTGAPTSFPSGHTAQAFTAATVFHKEYGSDHPALSFVAYSIATSIGVLRVLNNRHHASDVLAGAGIGILSTNLAYLTHQNKWRQRTKRKTNTIVSPFYSQGAVGVGMMVNVE